MKKSAASRGTAAAEEKRKAAQFWAPLNAMLREHMEQNGRRPSADVLARWFSANADAHWGQNKPSFAQAKSHARSVRPTRELAQYFREYRARKKAISPTGNSNSMIPAEASSPTTAEPRTDPVRPHLSIAEDPAASRARPCWAVQDEGCLPFRSSDPVQADMQLMHELMGTPALPQLPTPVSLRGGRHAPISKCSSQPGGALMHRLRLGVIAPEPSLSEGARGATCFRCTTSPASSIPSEASSMLPQALGGTNRPKTTDRLCSFGPSQEVSELPRLGPGSVNMLHLMPPAERQPEAVGFSNPCHSGHGQSSIPAGQDVQQEVVKVVQQQQMMMHVMQQQLQALQQQVVQHQQLDRVHTPDPAAPSVHSWPPLQHQPAMDGSEDAAISARLLHLLESCDFS